MSDSPQVTGSPWTQGLLYARTLTHLHPAQLALRPVQLARSTLLSRSRRLAAFVAGNPQATLGPPLLVLEGLLPPELPGVEAEVVRARRALGGEQLLVGCRVPLSPPHTHFDWDWPKLVSYQQAYFGIARSLAIASRVEGFAEADAAASLAAAHLRELVERLPPGTGVAWDPYPVAMRILNVLVARELLRPRASAGDAAFLDGALLRALAQHAQWLAANLELHLLGNHLFTDGVALFVSGAALETRSSLVWRAVGETIITRSLALDVLADGGHAERSPMYAALYLDQLQLVMAACRSLGRPAPAGALAASVSLGRFLRSTAHPDGRIPLLGDSAFDEAPEPADLGGPVGVSPESLRTRLYGRFVPAAPEPTAAAVALRDSFPESGFEIIRTGDEFLIMDAGPLGTTDQPGHAHADALSFELSCGGRRLITDGGAGHYDVDERRAYFRGPLAHSSVSVDERGSDEVWQSWRAGRRAEVDPVIHTVLDSIHVLRGGVKAAFGWRQSRLAILAPGQLLCVVDRIDGAAEGARVATHVHFGPDVTIEPAGTGSRVGQGERDFRFVPLIGGASSVHRGESAPWRGWTSFRMGEFEASPEIELEATALGECWGVAYALLLAPGADIRPDGTGIELGLADHDLHVAIDGGGLRWELRRRSRRRATALPAAVA